MPVFICGSNWLTGYDGVVVCGRRRSAIAPVLDVRNENGARQAPSSCHKDMVDQSLCQVWLLQISPPSTQPLILSEAPDNVALPE